MKKIKIYLNLIFKLSKIFGKLKFLKIVLKINITKIISKQYINKISNSVDFKISIQIDWKLFDVDSYMKFSAETQWSYNILYN
jgi:hypothetical protein